MIPFYLFIFLWGVRVDFNPEEGKFCIICSVSVICFSFSISYDILPYSPQCPYNICLFVILYIKEVDFLLMLMAPFDARGVGFLKYFQLKQLPNFLLASPILTLALCSIIYYVMAQPKLVFSLGFQTSKEGKDFAPVPFPLETVSLLNGVSASIQEKPSPKTEGKQILVCD